MRLEFESEEDPSCYSVTVFANEILEMASEIRRLRRENERLREIEKKYIKLSNDSLKASQDMAGTMLKIFSTPKVAETFAANADPGQFGIDKHCEEKSK